MAKALIDNEYYYKPPAKKQAYKPPPANATAYYNAPAPKPAPKLPKWFAPPPPNYVPVQEPAWRPQGDRPYMTDAQLPMVDPNKIAPARPENVMRPYTLPNGQVKMYTQQGYLDAYRGSKPIQQTASPTYTPTKNVYDKNNMMYAGVPNIFNNNPNFKLQTRPAQYNIYEEDAANYGLPGWTVPGMRPAGVPTPPAVQAGNNPMIYNPPPRRTAKPPIRRTAIPDIYEDDAVNYGLPGWTKPGMSPTGAPPPGTREPVSISKIWNGSQFANNLPASRNMYPQIYEDQATNYGLPGYTVPGMSPTGAPPPGTILPTSNYAWKAFDWLWHGNNPMRPSPSYGNRYDTMNAKPVRTGQTQSPTVSTPWASSNAPTARPPSNWNMAPTSRAEANAIPGKYRQPMSIADLTKWFANQPRKSLAELMAELNASGADPWASDPYDFGGTQYYDRVEEPINGGGGGGGYGGWGGGGGGYSDKHYNSNPNYVSGQRGYAQAHRQNMLVWNI